MTHTTMHTANDNTPLWKAVVLSLAKDMSGLDRLTKEAETALWEKAVEIMQPDAEELRSIEQDNAAKRDFMERFVKAYRMGLPPYSGFTSRHLPVSTD